MVPAFDRVELYVYAFMGVVLTTWLHSATKSFSKSVHHMSLQFILFRLEGSQNPVAVFWEEAYVAKLHFLAIYLLN